MKVIIDDIEYVPNIQINVCDEKILACLEVLTEMRYFKQNHKMQGLAWNAINALCPYLTKLSDEEAFDRIRVMTESKQARTKR